MKKHLFIVLLLILIFPFNCLALNITGVSLQGNDSVKEGETYTLRVKTDISGFDRNSYNTDGIYMVALELEIDDSIFTITGVHASGYESEIGKVDGSYYVLSVADDSNTNKCADEFLVCSAYELSISLYAKKTDVDRTKIRLTDFETGVFKVNSIGEYSIDDLKEVGHPVNDTRYITINHSSNNVDNPNSVVSSKVPSIPNSTVKNNNNQNNNSPSNSDNIHNDNKNNIEYFNYLNVKGYPINFKSNIYKYEVVIKKDVNKLDIEYEVKDSNTKVSVIGADDLKSNKDRVKIIAEISGNKKTYFITIKREEGKKDYSSTTNNLNRIVKIVLISIIFITILVISVTIYNKKKLKKYLNEYNEK